SVAAVAAVAIAIRGPVRTFMWCAPRRTRRGGEKVTDPTCTGQAEMCSDNRLRNVHVATPEMLGLRAGGRGPGAAGRGRGAGGRGPGAGLGKRDVSGAPAAGARNGALGAITPR